MIVEAAQAMRSANITVGMMEYDHNFVKRKTSTKRKG
ncbi:MAG: hypothetical protein QG670_2452 [Thermoproteota archaeon]|nr:hypothetical protein [Thermoproteota archaeon]